MQFIECFTVITFICIVCAEEPGVGVRVQRVNLPRLFRHSYVSGSDRALSVFRCLSCFRARKYVCLIGDVRDVAVSRFSLQMSTIGQLLILLSDRTVTI